MNQMVVGSDSVAVTYTKCPFEVRSNTISYV